MEAVITIQPEHTGKMLHVPRKVYKRERTYTDSVKEDVRRRVAY